MSSASRVFNWGQRNPALKETLLTRRSLRSFDARQGGGDDAAPVPHGSLGGRRPVEMTTKRWRVLCH